MAEPPYLSATRDGATLIRLRVKPGARTTEITGARGDALKVSVTAAPERGKANDAVIELLATALDLSKSEVSLVSGAASQDKVARLDRPLEEIVRRARIARWSTRS